MASQTGSEQSKASPSQYLITILTIAGTIGAAIIPILLNTYAGQTSNKPDVNLVVTPNLNHDGRKALIELTNRGSGAATSLSLTIQAPKNINTITNEFSSIDITMPRFNNVFLDMHAPKPINQSSLKLYIAKFSAGSGSVIRLETLMDGDAKQDSSYYDYTVSAAYDQGSTIGKVIRPSDMLSWSNFPNKVWEYVVENPILVASELAIVPATWIVLRWWSRKRFRNSHISIMKTTLLDLRRILKSVVRADNMPEFDSAARNVMFTSAAFLSALLKNLGTSILFSVPDLIRIRDITEKLSMESYPIATLHFPFSERKRKSDGTHIPSSNDISNFYKEGLDEFEKYHRKENEMLKTYYEDCLLKVNEALEKIDWTKYERL
jgi:hypothetical protein